MEEAGAVSSRLEVGRQCRSIFSQSKRPVILKVPQSV